MRIEEELGVYIEKIFERATIRGIADYLLFGSGPEEDNRSYEERLEELILSRLVDTFISKISLTMLPVPKPHNTACVLSWEEARRWQSRSSGYSSS